MSLQSFIDLTEDSDDDPERQNVSTRSYGSGTLVQDADGDHSHHRVPAHAFSMRAYRPLPRQSPQRSKTRHVPSHTTPSYRSQKNVYIQVQHAYGDALLQTQPLPKPYPESNASKMSSVQDGRTCVQCANYPDVSCDGDQPCAPCQAVGDDCVYPGQDPDTVRTQLAHRYHVGQQTTDNLSFQPSKDVPGVPSDTAGVGHVAVDGALHAYSENDGDFEEVDGLEDTTRHDLDSLEGIKNLLQVHEARMRAHHEYIMQPLLARAKLECINSPAVATQRRGPNPFDRLAGNGRIKGPNSSKAMLTVQLRSHTAGSMKKWTTMATPLFVTARDQTILPKYKSIGRLGSTILARNSYVKKYLPYFADEVPEAEKKREEDIAKWYQTDHDSMYRQRNCLELVQLWKPTVEQFISNLEIQFKDVLWYILSINVNRRCTTCEKAIKRERFAAVLELLNKPDERSLKRARLACDALEEVAEIHMWHIVAELDYVKSMIDSSEQARRPNSSLCTICFVHDCMSHGFYDEPSDEESGTFAFMGGSGGKRRPMMINDDEKDVNRHTSMVVPRRSRAVVHQCGIYCVDATTPIKAVLGRKSDGTAGGVFNRTTKVTRPTFDNFEECGTQCFWQVDKRIRFTTVAQTKNFEPHLSVDGRTLFMRHLKLFAANQRVPCMIARDLEDLTCIDAFYYILAVGQHPAHFEQARIDLQEQSLQKLSRSVQGIDTSMSSELDERPPFIPCSHEGPCNENVDCSCSQDQIHCEFFCGCDSGCKRRFHGCSCAAKNKTCFNDDRCECWAQNRECDPWLCKSCGAVEVLDPANKYRDEIRKGRCRNTNLQLGLPARTIKAPSEVQGWGLYAGQDLEPYTFIGEYKGEIVGNQESDRRGSIYHHLGQEYLFVTNNEQQIDGSNFGNKTRFINNSQRHDYINVLAKKLLCYGVQRVMLYAKRPIRAGDELLYNYNYPDSVTKTFWERGEGPAQISGAVVAKPALPTTNGRIAKIAEVQGPERSDSRSRVVNRRNSHHFRQGDEGSRHSSKRKRVSDVDAYNVGTAPGMPNGDHAMIDETDMSDYEEVEAASGVDDDDDDEAEEADGHESFDDSSEDIRTPSTAIRKRRIHPHDGRFGGNAQRKAWETRKNRARVSSS